MECDDVWQFFQWKCCFFSNATFNFLVVRCINKQCNSKKETAFMNWSKLISLRFTSFSTSFSISSKCYVKIFGAIQNDVTQIWTILDLPPIVTRLITKVYYARHKIIDLLPLIRWLYLRTIPWPKNAARFTLNWILFFHNFHSRKTIFHWIIEWLNVWQIWQSLSRHQKI